MSRADPPKPASPVNATNGRSISYSPMKPAGSFKQPNIYLEQIAAAERQYTQHLSTIAPYIQAAFTQWYAQDASPGLADFLIHYFGRPPNASELQQIQQLLSLKTQLSRDQEKLRGLHSQAATFDPKIEASNGHWSPPSATRRFREMVRSSRSRSRSPIKKPVNANSNPLSAKPRSQGVPEVSEGIEMEEPSMSVHFVDGLHPPSAPTPVTATSASIQWDGLAASRSTRNQPADGEMYERLACVGEGTYGKVYKARKIDTGAFVALKRIRMEGEKDGFPVTAMREIKLLQSLRDDNVVRLQEMMVSKGKFPLE